MTELQEKIALLHPDDSSIPISLDTVKKKMPRHLVGRIASLNSSILVSLEEDERVFLDAVEALQKGLKSQLGNNRVISVNFSNK